jgi:hypothetical protein
MDPDADDTEYGLVMPFVVVESAGGPYDDEAFCAGYDLGTMDTLLTQHPQFHNRTIRTACLPQADLLAMRHGYSMRHAESSTYWTVVELTRNAT